MIKNLIFDFGKVLVDYDFDAFIERLFDQPEKRTSFARLVTDPALMDRCDKEDTPFGLDYQKVANTSHIRTCYHIQ